MIEFINRMTGTRMWVADDRVEEYKAAGHAPAADIVEPEEKPTKPTKSIKAVKTKKTKGVRNHEVRDS